MTAEIASNPKPTVINIPSTDGVAIEQTSTRGDGIVELGEAFQRSEIDTMGLADHLRIHTEGQIAGSQFNGELFQSPEEVIDLVMTAIPDTLHYDQHNRAELTLTIADQTIGFTGVKSLEELKKVDGVSLRKDNRTPGGEDGELEGIEGAYYPETARNTETGTFDVVVDEAGQPKNPHAKFVPKVWIAAVPTETTHDSLATDKVTVILQKNPEDNRPVALTIFPGENAPPQPVRIDTETYKMDSLQGGPEASYWAEHAFIESAKT